RGRRIAEVRCRGRGPGRRAGAGRGAGTRSPGSPRDAGAGGAVSRAPDSRPGGHQPAVALRSPRHTAAARAGCARPRAADAARGTRHPCAPGRAGTAWCLIATEASLKLRTRAMILATTPAFEPLQSVATLPAVDPNVSRVGATARDFVLRSREELRQRHDAGAGGLVVVAAYTDAVDRLVEWLFAKAASHYHSKNPRLNQRCTVVAQGGYGRGELNIESDIDLLL